MLLTFLWATGIPLVGLSIGWHLAVLADNPKLLAKITVVVALTMNGVLLHFLAFPLLQRSDRHLSAAACVASVLGAISTVSWLYASFLGAARVIAPLMSLEAFLSTYAALILGGVTVAVVVVRPRVKGSLVKLLQEGDDAHYDAESATAWSNMQIVLPTMRYRKRIVRMSKRSAARSMQFRAAFD